MGGFEPLNSCLITGATTTPLHRLTYITFDHIYVLITHMCKIDNSYSVNTTKKKLIISVVGSVCNVNEYFLSYSSHL